MNPRAFTLVAAALIALTFLPIRLHGQAAAAPPAEQTASIATPAIQRDAATYLGIAGLAFPCLGGGLILATAFQATGRPLWPLLGSAARAGVVTAGGALVVYGADGGLIGLAIAAAAGQLAYGTVLVAAFRAGRWRRDAVAQLTTP